MATETPTKPVDTPIARVNDEIAVGSDMEFQQRWWRFERIVWIAFTVLLALDLVGAFGRGPLAKGHLQTSDGSVRVEYDRIERYSTPSVLTVKFGDAAIRDGKAQLWVSDSVLKQLGNQRTVPQPESSELSANGILYTFKSGPQPDSVKFTLQPTEPGVFHMELRRPGAEELRTAVVVMP